MIISSDVEGESVEQNPMNKFVELNKAALVLVDFTE